MSFNKYGIYVGEYDSSKVHLKTNDEYVLLPLGHNIMYNEIVKPGDLRYHHDRCQWMCYSYYYYGKNVTLLARKNKTVNQIFIDM